MAAGEPIGVFPKDPDSIEPYTVDWGTLGWLGSDTIASSTWTVPAGITEVSASSTTTVATILLSGGTSGASYSLVNEITTAAGLKDNRTIQIDMIER